ncbi:hypothetical protein VTL71DRAFT_7317 [Oculimacula yallundae]|uniref:Uncharacterized protein n=1 Tax=Oculimacula yallundae TaxID=86028 RepID=A0ABR4BY15_9HELO
MVLISPYPIEIRSPRRKPSLMTLLKDSDGEEDPPHESFADILRASWTVYGEAVDIYYKKNTFIFGLGGNNYGSKIEANEHGRNAFLKRIPKGLLALIRTVEIHMFAMPHDWTIDRNPGIQQKIRDSKDLYTITRFILKDLKGIRSLSIHDHESVSLINKDQLQNFPVIVRHLRLTAIIFGRLVKLHCQVSGNSNAPNPVLDLRWAMREADTGVMTIMQAKHRDKSVAKGRWWHLQVARGREHN